jgi:hypothetical protein
VIHESDAMLDRVRRRAIALGALAAAGVLFFDWRAAVSLTIGAVVVILSFLVLERLTERLLPRPDRKVTRTLLPLLLVTGASLILLGSVLWRWREFDPIAGAIGLSVVVLAIVPEAFRRPGA